MTDSADIAVISFISFINGGDVERREVAKQLYEAFSTIGWVYLKDFGIPKERIDEIFVLVSCGIVCQRHLLTKCRLRLSSTSHSKRRALGVSKMQK